MRIRRVSLREVHLSLKERFEISTGGWTERRVLLLRMESEEAEAWSECVAAEAPNYSYETPETAWHILTDHVLPAILGRDFQGPGDILDPVHWIRGHPMALAAVEMGAWALEAAAAQVPLYQLLGGVRESVPVGVSVGLQPTDEQLVAKVGDRLAQGYGKVKLKIKPGRDLGMVEAVRRAFPRAPLMVDANASYSLDHAGLLKELDQLDLMMLEQPLGFQDLREHALLQSRIETPICLDESIRNPGDTHLALKLGSCRIVNVKPGRVGGFGASKAIHDIAADRGVPVWCGGMLETGIGRAYNLALASLPNFLLPGDISESRRYWIQDVVEPEFVMEGGMMSVPSGPGIGVKVREDRIEKLTARLWERDA
jgi:O-succinylbenzoate synthase